MDSCGNRGWHARVSNRLIHRSKLRTEIVWRASDDNRKQLDECRRKEAIVKAEPLDQILLRFVENLDSHRDFLRIFVLAVSQSLNRALPSATLWRRSTRTSSCQAGDSTASGERLRSSQSSSIAASLSRSDICFRGRVTDMPRVYTATALGFKLLNPCETYPGWSRFPRLH